MTQRLFVVVDRDREVLAGPFGCLSRAVDEWDPEKSYLRVQLGGGRLVLLTELERSEARRVDPVEVSSDAMIWWMLTDRPGHRH